LKNRHVREILFPVVYALGLLFLEEKVTECHYEEQSDVVISCSRLSDGIARFAAHSSQEFRSAGRARLCLARNDRKENIMCNLKEQDLFKFDGKNTHAKRTKAPLISVKTCRKSLPRKRLYLQTENSGRKKEMYCLPFVSTTSWLETPASGTLLLKFQCVKSASEGGA